MVMLPLAQALPVVPLASGSDLAKALLISGLVFLAFYIPWQWRAAVFAGFSGVLPSVKPTSKTIS